MLWFEENEYIYIIKSKNYVIYKGEINMSDFIQGDNFDKSGGEAEQIVWTRVREAFAKREVLGYSRYPLFSRVGERRKEPDILLLDKE